MLSFIWRTNRTSPTARKTQSQFHPRIEPLEDRCLLSGGVLDPTFGSGGIVATSAAVSSGANAVATYPNAGTANDGKVVAVGFANSGTRSSTDEIAVLRYNPSGSLDTSFGGTGEVITNLKNGGIAYDVAIQPDGKVVIAGTSGGAFALVRYNADGSLDTTFGGKSQGVVLTSIGKFSNDNVFSLGLQPDGKIVVAGTTNSNTGRKLALLRYTSTGALDTSFGTGGIVTTQLASSINDNNPIDLALDVSALDPNAGKIVVVARLLTQGNPDVVVRYNADGSLDTSFARGAGYETLVNLTYFPSVAIQSNGQIVVASTNGAQGNPPMEFDRLNPGGSFDATFGSGGIVVVSQPTNATYNARDVAIQSDGKIVVGGSFSPSAGQVDFMLSRFNSADGSLDTSFGTGGSAVSSGIGINPMEVGMALDPDGRIVVAGSTLPSANFAVARFLAYGPEIGSFSASPNPVTAGSSLTLTASNISDEIPSAAITQVACYVQINGTNTLLGYGTQSNTSEWTLTFTVNLAPGTYTLFAQAEDSYGVFGDATALTLTVQ
jgi:uncharacterized delta-60 repeat protein